jgi:predicted  nucleic acid-binding Zn-ribbon protein
MMNDKDCKELEKTLSSLERGPNDLEQQIERLKFRNEVLHKANQKQQDEILDLRTKIKKLEYDAVNQFRNNEGI